MILIRSFMCALAIVTGFGQVPAPTSEQTGKIHGRVTDRENGQPLARAVVHLRRDGQQEELVAQTDESGRYRFNALPEGRYSGFVTPGAYRSTYLSEGLRTADRIQIRLQAGDTREVDVSLRRGLAIDVRVVDRWGVPLSGLTVDVLSAETRRRVGGSPRMTDDRGRLRVFGLRPGRYVLCAEPRNLSRIFSPASDSRRDRVLRTCYPSVLDDRQAEAVRVERDDVGELEIRMRLGRTFIVSGQVLDSSGAPAAGAHVSLVRSTAGGSSSSGRPVDANGRFRIANIHPGDYAIDASLGGSDHPQLQRPFEGALVPIRVDADDLEDLQVLLKPGADVAGRLTTDDPVARLPPSPGSGLMVYTRLEDDLRAGPGSRQSDLVSEDRTFLLRDLFGRRHVDVVNVPRGWYVKSIRYGSRDILDEATEFRTDKDAPPLVVVLSNQGATIAGRVVDDLGNPVARPRVCVLRNNGPPLAAHEVCSTSTSQTGAFRLGPMRAGEYLVAALSPQSRVPLPGESDAPARLAAVADRIVLSEFDERIVELRVVTVK